MRHFEQREDQFECYDEFEEMGLVEPDLATIIAALDKASPEVVRERVAEIFERSNIVESIIAKSMKAKKVVEDKEIGDAKPAALLALELLLPVYVALLGHTLKTQQADHVDEVLAAAKHFFWIFTSKNRYCLEEETYNSLISLVKVVFTGIRSENVSERNIFSALILLQTLFQNASGIHEAFFINDIFLKKFFLIEIASVLGFLCHTKVHFSFNQAFLIRSVDAVAILEKILFDTLRKIADGGHLAVFLPLLVSNDELMQRSLLSDFSTIIKYSFNRRLYSERAFGLRCLNMVYGFIENLMMVANDDKKKIILDALLAENISDGFVHIIFRDMVCLLDFFSYNFNREIVRKLSLKINFILKEFHRLEKMDRLIVSMCQRKFGNLTVKKNIFNFFRSSLGYIMFNAGAFPELIRDHIDLFFNFFPKNDESSFRSNLFFTEIDNDILLGFIVNIGSYFSCSARPELVFHKKLDIFLRSILSDCMNENHFPKLLSFVSSVFKHPYYNDIKKMFDLFLVNFIANLTRIVCDYNVDDSLQTPPVISLFKELLGKSSFRELVTLYLKMENTVYLSSIRRTYFNVLLDIDDENMKGFFAIGHSFKQVIFHRNNALLFCEKSVLIDELTHRLSALHASTNSFFAFSEEKELKRRKHVVLSKLLDLLCKGPACSEADLKTFSEILRDSANEEWLSGTSSKTRKYVELFFKYYSPVIANKYGSFVLPENSSVGAIMASDFGSNVLRPREI